MTWILHDAYLLGGAGTIIIKETANDELKPFTIFRNPGETDQQLDARAQVYIGRLLDGENVYLQRRVNTKGRWQPRGNP
jgi:hypothetical protein